MEHFDASIKAEFPEHNTPSDIEAGLDTLIRLTEDVRCSRGTRKRESGTSPPGMTRRSSGSSTVSMPMDTTCFSTVACDNVC
jgi:hypothetical protein